MLCLQTGQARVATQLQEDGKGCTSVSCPDPVPQHLHAPGLGLVPPGQKGTRAAYIYTSLWGSSSEAAGEHKGKAQGQHSANLAIVGEGIGRKGKGSREKEKTETNEKQ